MADIETSIAITAQTDDLLSGMRSAADAVQATVDGIKSQFADLSSVAQQTQTDIATASTQVKSAISELQVSTAQLAGLAGAPGRVADGGGAAYQLPGVSIRQLTDITRGDGPDQNDADELNRQSALEQDYYEKRLAAAQNDAENQNDLNDQQSRAYERYLDDRYRLDVSAAANSQKEWEKVLPLGRILSTTTTDLLTGASTIPNALGDIVNSVIKGLVNSGVKTVFGEIGNLLAGGLFGQGIGQDFSGVAGIAGENFLGGGLFGSLFAGIGSLFGFEHGGIVPSAQGGWMVPSASLALLHTNEMVLPARISEGLQSMIASGTSALPTGPVFINVSAVDGQSVAALFKNHGSALVAALNQAMRNGSTLRSS